MSFHSHHRHLANASALDGARAPVLRLDSGFGNNGNNNVSLKQADD